MSQLPWIKAPFTLVWSTKTFVKVAVADKTYKQKIYLILIKQLRKCLPLDVLIHAESILTCDRCRKQDELLNILKSRKPEMTTTQLARLKSY